MMTAEIIRRLEVLLDKLRNEGRLFDSDTVELAIEELRQ